ncbi:MAG: SRPBCC domain-containing protein [Bacteroidota bacterium]
MSQAKSNSVILILAVASTLADAQVNDNNNLNSKVMSTADFTTVILVDQSPAEAFKAITNVRGWWSEEIEGSTDKLNEVFYYHFEDVHHCTIKVTEVVPNEKVVWHVLDNYFKFTKDKTEWNDTKISFEISKAGDKTQIRFTHIGLIPAYECYPICRDAWTTYIQKSLRNLIVTGKGNPNGKSKPQTENEKILMKKK